MLHKERAAIATLYRSGGPPVSERKLKRGPHAPHTKRPPSATFVHVEHTRLELVTS